MARLTVGTGKTELSELALDMLDVAENRYPDEVKKFLKKQADEGKAGLKELTAQRTTKRTGNLLKGIGRTAPKIGTYFAEAKIHNKAPHAHLIESGHIIWAPVGGMGSARRRKTNKRTRAFRPAADYAEQLQKTFPKDVEEWIGELVEKGLDLR